MNISGSVERIDSAVQAGDKATITKVTAAQAARDTLIANLRELSPYTVQLPDGAAAAAYEQVIEAERLVAPTLHREDYREGTAKIADEVKVLMGSGSLLLSADHATDPIRCGVVHAGADHGTAGLVGVLRDYGHGTAVVPLGRQTGNANADLNHPLKAALTRHINGKRGFLSIHGMMPGKFTHQYDQTEVHGVLGLGYRYNEETHDIAGEAIRRIRDETGLRVVIGNESRLYLPNALPQLMKDEVGVIKYSQLAAVGVGTTTNHIRSLSSSTPAMQVELSRAIRFLPKDMEYRDPEAARIGVYMGLLVVRRLSEIMSTYEKADPYTL